MLIIKVLQGSAFLLVTKYQWVAIRPCPAAICSLVFARWHAFKKSTFQLRTTCGGGPFAISLPLFCLEAIRNAFFSLCALTTTASREQVLEWFLLKIKVIALEQLTLG